MAFTIFLVFFFNYLTIIITISFVCLFACQHRRNLKDKSITTGTVELGGLRGYSPPNKLSTIYIFYQYQVIRLFAVNQLSRI